jgi:uncharacterized membrane protein
MFLTPHSMAGRVTSREVASIALCAALYASTSYLTSYITIPGSIIQLRPAVVIPAVFAVVFSPLVGGLGAAIGTFIASIFRYGTPLLTLFSGTPANFICFYLLGRLSRPYNLKNFIIATIVGYVAGSLIIGLGLALLGILFMSSLAHYATAAGFSTAFTATFGTGVLFTLLLAPPLLKLSLAIPGAKRD